MQAILGKSRLLAGCANINLKNLNAKTVMGSPLIRSGRSVQSIMGSSCHPLLFTDEGYSTKVGFLVTSTSHVVAPTIRLCQGPIAGLSRLNMGCAGRRFVTTAEADESVLGGTSDSVSDAPSRIKFKRLDKTARNIMNILNKEAVETVKTNREIPDIQPGYTVQLKVEVPENKRRVSIIKGIVIARRNAGINTTFRLRRLVAGVGIESLFPLYSPNLKEIKVLDKKKVRRAKLYYLRDKMNALKKR